MNTGPYRESNTLATITNKERLQQFVLDSETLNSEYEVLCQQVCMWLCNINLAPSLGEAVLLNSHRYGSVSKCHEGTTIAFRVPAVVGRPDLWIDITAFHNPCPICLKIVSSGCEKMLKQNHNKMEIILEEDFYAAIIEVLKIKNK